MGESQDGGTGAPLGSGQQEKGQFLAGQAGTRVAQFQSAGNGVFVLTVVAPAFGGEASEVHGVTGGFVTTESGWEPPFAQEVQVGFTTKHQFHRARFFPFQNTEMHGGRLPKPGR